MRRVAVVGSGIAGLAVAHALRNSARVTLFEADRRFGGHANTVDLTLGGVTHGVDTGFLVLNERTYPKLLQLFAELGVETVKSDMSFSVQDKRSGLEWSGSNLGSVFAQRANLLRPRFWNMLREVLRFNALATRLARAVAVPASPAATALESIGEFLDRERFGREFREWYFLPMVGSIWSCPTAQMLRFPVATMLRFCDNHGLLQVTNRPQWHTVRGGARHYVEKIARTVADRRLNTPVRSIRRAAAGAADASVWVSTEHGTEPFDALVLACHSDQSLALLADPSDAERAVLGAIRYQTNRAVLHTDESVLPTRRNAWAAWNYERAADASGDPSSDPEEAVCLHYWLNRLQPLPFHQPVIVSLNPLRAPRADMVHAEIDYAHPVFDAAAIAAQQRLSDIQGRGHTWFCGAWTRYGFHEDGLVSGLAVAERLRAAAPAPAESPCPMPVAA